MGSRLIKIIFLIIPLFLLSQIEPLSPVKNSSKKEIELIHSDLQEIKESFYDGAVVHSGNVEIKHETSILKADSVIIFKNNILEARGNVLFTDRGNELTCSKLSYDESARFATAYNSVRLKGADGKQTETEIMYYDLNSNIAYFNDWGVISDSQSTINTKEARYYLNSNKVDLGEKFNIDSKDSFIEGSQITYFTKTNISKFDRYIVINSKKDSTVFIEGSNGEYNGNTKESVLRNDGKVHYKGKILTGDELYFNEDIGYGKGKSNIKIDNPDENQFLKGNFGEIFIDNKKEKDSCIITDRAYMLKKLNKDSIYIHADSLFGVKTKDLGTEIRGYHKGRFFKSNASGKADSIVYKDLNSTIDFYKSPIFWFSGGRQIVADTITTYLGNDKKNIDSIYARQNIFLISKVDSLSYNKEFNQAKGKFMRAYFSEGNLDKVDLVGNAESISYLDQDKNAGEKDRIGIVKSWCGIIRLKVVDREIQTTSCVNDAKSKLYPETLLSEEDKFLIGFDYREGERLKKWEDIFDDIPPDKIDKPMKPILEDPIKEKDTEKEK